MNKWLLLGSALFTLSCNSNDKKADDPSIGAETKTSGNALYGKWKVATQSVNGENRSFAPGDVQFKETGEFIGLTGVVFKYTIKDDSLFLTSDQNKAIDKCKIILSDIEKGTLKFQTLVQDTLTIETVFQKEN